MEIPKRFIVVDDDSTNNIICNYAIQRVFPGMDIQLFENPILALNTIKETYSELSHDVSTVLLLDINMPEMTGWEFLAIFKEFSDHIHKQFSVFILTSSVSNHDKVTSELTPFVSGFFSKPLSGDWMRETFNNKVIPCQPSARLLPCYRVTANSSGIYRFKLLDKNEAKILIRSAESFKNLDDCKKAIEVCRQVIPNEKKYVRLHLGKYFFRTVNSENSIIAVSEMYASSYIRELAIKDTKRDGVTENLEVESMPVAPGI